MLIYTSTMIGRIIQGIIESEGLSYREVAEDLNIDHASLYRSLMDGGNPEWKTIEKLLDYLGYDFTLVKRKGVKKDMASTSRSKDFQNKNEAIHENLQKLFQKCRGEILEAKEVKNRYAREFKNPDVMWVQASDHVINPNRELKSPCRCVGTEKAIFEKIRRGEYKVR